MSKETFEKIINLVRNVYGSFLLVAGVVTLFASDTKKMSVFSIVLGICLLTFTWKFLENKKYGKTIEYVVIVIVLLFGNIFL